MRRKRRGKAGTGGGGEGRRDARVGRPRSPGRPARERPGDHHRPLRVGQDQRQQLARGPRLPHGRQPAVAAAARVPRATRASWSPATGGSPSSPTCGFRASRGVPGDDPLDRPGRIDLTLLFLEASDESLVRRFSETRRPHPLAPDRPAIEGIRNERELLADLRGEADRLRHQRVVDPRGPGRGLPGASRSATARRRDGRHPRQLRLQARHPLRHRPAVRRPLPPQPALRAGPAELTGQDEPVQRVPRGAAGLRGARRPPGRPARFTCCPLYRSGVALRLGGHRLHRRPAPLGGHRRGPQKRLAARAQAGVVHRDVERDPRGTGTRSEPAPAALVIGSRNNSPRTDNFPSVNWSLRQRGLSPRLKHRFLRDDDRDTHSDPRRCRP
jgi:hypothetical protein